MLANDVKKVNVKRLALITAVAALTLLQSPLSYPLEDASEGASGGATSVNANNRHAFSQPAANMPLAQKLNFSVGNSFFHKPWVIAPSTTTARDGLGPLYNTNACQNCHIRDGRGHPPEADSRHAVSLLVRLSVPPLHPLSALQKQQLQQLGVIPEPRYGSQLQDFAIPGLKSEGQIDIHYSQHPVQLAQGELVQLRKPHLAIRKLNYGPLAADVMMSARIAPAMIGLGLLQAVSEETVLAHADPQDRNQDGISGRANRVWNVQTQHSSLGRFGWKAGQPNLRQQNAAAFNGDLGISSSLFPKDACTPTQSQCLRSAQGGRPELADHLLKQVTFYTHNLAVPMQRKSADTTHAGNIEPDTEPGIEQGIEQGKALFQQANCSACHLPTLTTGQSPFPWLAQQTISPYTDLLLHDMGDGLADGRPEFQASGREWRTAPLWGIGLTATVVGKAYFLHDGRARTLQEAILWHGGEAEKAKQRFKSMNKHQRDALLAFLQSL